MNRQRLEDLDVVVAEIPRGADACVRVRARSVDGRPFVDVRVFEQGLATPRGVALRVGELVDVAIALQRAMTRIVQLFGGPEPRRARRTA